MTDASNEMLAKVQLALDKNCPPPEEDLAILGKCIASRPVDNLTGDLTRAADNTETFVDEIRWHLGQAILLWEQYPELGKIGDSDGPFQGFLGVAPLLLRKYTHETTKVLYSDLSTPRRGGTVAGWTFQMMMDSSIYRSIAALDRIARILWVLVGRLPPRVYFRSKQLTEIHSVLREPESQELLSIAKGELLALLLDFRDGFTHNRKFGSRLAGFTIRHAIGVDGGRPVYERPSNIQIEDFFAIANAGYHQVTDALSPLAKLCVKRWPMAEESQ